MKKPASPPKSTFIRLRTTIHDAGTGEVIGTGEHFYCLPADLADMPLAVLGAHLMISTVTLGVYESVPASPKPARRTRTKKKR